MKDSDAELIHGYLDRTLSQDEQRLLNDRIKNDFEFSQEFVSFTLLHNHLHDEYAIKEDLEKHSGTMPSYKQAASTSAPHRLRRMTAWSSVAIALVLMVSVGLFFIQKDQPKEIGTLVEVQGEANVIGKDHSSRSVTNGMKIYSGDKLQTEGFQSSLMMQYQDGTRLLLIGNTEATCLNDNGQKKINVSKGLVSASVKPQPQNRPMVMITNEAEVEVLGTEFVLQATSTQTDIDVSHGKVKLTRLSDDQSVEVSSGKRAFAREGTTMQTEEIPSPPFEWVADYENGMKENQVGTFVQTDLPAGSKGAAKASFFERFGGHYIVAVCNDDIQGLAAIGKNSHLHITFKVTAEHTHFINWLNLFIATRSLSPINPEYQRFKNVDLSANMPRLGKWRTITIPLTRFQRRSNSDRDINPAWTGGSPSTDDVIYSVWVGSPPPDRGLVIDKIWITKEGPGDVVVKDVR